MENTEITKLRKELEDLRRELELSKKQQILKVGKFDGTNIQVSVDGIRRKIATTSP